MATATEVRTLLAGTSLPSGLADTLVDGASAVWLMGEPADVLATDLVLCHPRLRAGEVRAAARPTTADDVWRLTVVTHDRPGILAGAAGVLSTNGLQIDSASVNTWPDLAVALVRLSVTDTSAPSDDGASTTSRWDEIGRGFRQALGSGDPPRPAFTPKPPVRVRTTAEAGDRTVVHVDAPDRVGLLWATSHWLADQGVNIEVARARSENGRADDTFVVVGTVDAAALTRHLGGGDVEIFSALGDLAKMPLDAARGAASGALSMAKSAWNRRPGRG